MIRSVFKISHMHRFTTHRSVGVVSGQEREQLRAIIRFVEGLYKILPEKQRDHVHGWILRYQIQLAYFQHHSDLLGTTEDIPLYTIHFDESVVIDEAKACVKHCKKLIKRMMEIRERPMFATYMTTYLFDYFQIRLLEYSLHQKGQRRPLPPFGEGEFENVPAAFKQPVGRLLTVCLSKRGSTA